MATAEARLDLQRRTERFVLGALESLRSPASPAGQALFAVTLPPEVDPLGRYQEPRLVAFDRDVADTWGADYVTLGSYLVDNLMDAARKRGRTGNLFLPWTEAAQRLPDGWRESVPGLSFANRRAEVEAAEVVFHRFVLWDFRVTLVADERRDIPVSLLSDPLSEEVEVLSEPDEGPRLLAEAVGWTDVAEHAAHGREARGNGRRGGGTRTGADYQLLRLYRRACQLLETVVKDEVDRFAAAAGERLTAESERLRAYYAALEKESLEELRRAVHRVASLGVRYELSRSSAYRDRLASEVAVAKREMELAERGYRREVEALAKELKRRTAELEEKYRPTVTATLIGAAYLFRPRLEYLVKLHRRRGDGAPVQSTIYFDLLEGKVAGLTCPSCGAPLSEAYLDDGGELVCPECVFYCAGCGQASTMPASSRRCHLCGEEFCRDCLKACPGGGFAAGSRLRVCPRCGDLWCEACRNLASAAD